MASLSTGVGGAPLPVAGLPESHRNSPLAPSQEMAYRQKCIELQRRLSEIEANNEIIRRTLIRERHFQIKMRLNRAILLNHLKELVENFSNRSGDDKMERGATNLGGRMTGLQADKGNGFAFDESSEISFSDEVQEPDERPLRVKRARDGTPRASAAIKPASASNTPLAANSSVLPAYHSSGLPQLVPANAFSPAGSAAPLDPHPASFRLFSSASNAAVATLQSHHTPQQAHHQPMISLHQMPTATLPPPAPVDTSLPPPPVRPTPPFDQFTAHLVPQLQADNIPDAKIGPKIRETWNEIGDAGQEPWNRKYEEEMLTYEKAMDEYKRAHREGGRGTEFANGGGGGGGFSAVNK